MGTIRHDLLEIDGAALVRIVEASRLRRIPARRIREAIVAGRLRAIRIGAWTRVRLGDLDDWIDSHSGELWLREVGTPSGPRLRGALEEARAELARRVAVDAPDVAELPQTRDAIESALLALDAESER